MMEWWLSLNLRDRKILISGMILLIMMGVYALIWDPLQHNLKRSNQLLIDKQVTLNWIIDEAKIVDQFKRKPIKKRNQNTSLLTLIDKSARQNNIKKYIAKMKETSDRNIRLRINEIEFNRLILWLGKISRHHGIFSTEFNAEATGKTGIINAALTLDVIR